MDFFRRGVLKELHDMERQTFADIEGIDVSAVPPNLPTGLADGPQSNNSSDSRSSSCSATSRGTADLNVSLQHDGDFPPDYPDEAVRKRNAMAAMAEKVQQKYGDALIADAPAGADGVDEAKALTVVGRRSGNDTRIQMQMLSALPNMEYPQPSGSAQDSSCPGRNGEVLKSSNSDIWSSCNRQERRMHWHDSECPDDHPSEKGIVETKVARNFQVSVTVGTEACASRGTQEARRPVCLTAAEGHASGGNPREALRLVPAGTQEREVKPRASDQQTPDRRR
jgi:hypothetical protein